LCETASARFCKERWARLRVHGSDSVHGLCGLGVGVRSRKLTSVADEVRVWSFNLQTLGDRLDAPTDRASRLSLCHGCDVRVQLECVAAPTSWIRCFARRHVGGATASSRSAPRVIAAMRIAHPRVAPPTAADRCAPLAAGIGTVRKAASIIAIINARIARA
jgi:hypothetical protein